VGGTGEVTSVGKQELDRVGTGQRLRAVTLGYDTHEFVLNGRLIFSCAFITVLLLCKEICFTQCF
jgi:hypothetical protein